MIWLPATWMLVLQVVAAPDRGPGVDAPCAAQRAQQRDTWRVAGPPRRQPPNASGGTVWHWPTDTLGVWVVESHDPALALVSLQRIAPDHVTKVRWSAACDATTTTEPRPPETRHAFTDGDLRRVLSQHPRGLIYVWSPHMPLSVEGVATIRMLGARMGLAVTVLLDPNAAPATARAVVTARGWAADDGRVVASTELVFRDVLVHAPSVQAYAGGRLVGSPYPGFHTEDEYRAFLERVLSATP